MPQLMLEGDVDTRDATIFGLKEQVRNLQEELRSERTKNNGVSEGVRDLKRSLLPLYSALQKIFDGMGPMGESEAAPRSSAIWDSWKKKLSAGEGRAIDALLLHGEMTVPQLRIHIGCATRTAQNVAASLSGKGLAVRQSGRIRLKEL